MHVTLLFHLKLTWPRTLVGVQRLNSLPPQLLRLPPARFARSVKAAIVDWESELSLTNGGWVGMGLFYGSVSFCA